MFEVHNDTIKKHEVIAFPTKIIILNENLHKTTIHQFNIK